MATGSIGNTLQKNKVPMGLIERILMVPLTNDAGTEFFIDVSSGNLPITQATFDGWLRDDDKSERLIDMGIIDGFAPSKEENVTQTTERGNVYQIRRGVYSYAFRVDDPDVTIIESYQEAFCGAQDWGFYIVDDCGNIFGEEKSENSIYPIPLASGTYSGDYMWHTETEVSHIMVTFNLDRKFDAGRLNRIDKDQITADVKNPVGVYNVLIKNVASITTTGYDFDIVYQTGGAGSQTVVGSLVTADFNLDEITPTPASLSPTITDNGVGVSPRYSVSYSAETTGDVLELTSSAAMITKGFEIQNATDKRVTIP